ncbi:MAG: hypothetical protein MHM6MM_002353 [Cercozoa sp. M6MM]
MPPKPKKKPTSTKDRKKKEKAIVDKTFGMKNKKGAKAQKHIAVMKKGLTDKRQVEADRKKAEAKARKKELQRQAQAEATAMMKAIADKKAKKEAEEKKRLEEALANPALGGKKKKKKGKKGKKKNDGPTEEELADVYKRDPLFEQKLDAQRSLLMDGRKLTPLTHEVFMEWKRKKNAEKQKQIEENARYKMAKGGKKKGGRGHKGALTGRELYAIKRGIFADDEEADDETYEVRESEETEEPATLEAPVSSGPVEQVAEQIDESLFLDDDLDADLLADDLDDI